MKIKVSEATSPVLGWMVARAEGHRVSLSRNWYSEQDEETFSMKVSWKRDGTLDAIHWWSGQFYSPSTDWSQGGPIIEREGIAIHPSPTWTARYGLTVLAHHGGFRGHFQCTGPTPLIAAMRCFVTSKLGDEVEVPEELS